MIKTAFFDMDNTLIETQALYEEARAVFVPFVRSFCSFPQKDILEKLTQEEIALFDKYGYGRHMLPHAYANTLKHFHKDASADDITRAEEIANDVYRKIAAPKQGAMEAVSVLSSSLKVCLVTVGDAEVQQKRVNALSCKDAFHKIFIVAKKDVATYRSILADTGTSPEEAVMVGDSLKSDILPAIEAGMQAIFIPANNWVAREMTGVALPEKGVVELSDMRAAAQEICARNATANFKPALKPRQRRV